MSGFTMQRVYNTVEACHTRKDTRQVLKYVNNIRKQLNLRPLRFLARGKIGSGTGCSIAASLTTKYTVADVDGGHIGVTRYARMRGNHLGAVVQQLDVTPPKYVTEWIEAFDEGLLKGLVK